MNESDYKKSLTDYAENITSQDILDSLGSEFLRINNKPSNMLSKRRICIYSALLNYSKAEIEKTQTYKSFLNIRSDIYENWDQIRRIFIEFLENLSKRTINY